MHAQRKALRAPAAFDGLALPARWCHGARRGEMIAGVEPFGHDVPADWPVTTYAGTVLPGLFALMMLVASIMHQESHTDTRLSDTDTAPP